MSVAVVHQYCGALGKQANCQVAVSVHAVTDAASCPLQWRLFVPEEWQGDVERWFRTGIPEEIGHREKWRLALDILDELARWGLVPPVVSACTLPRTVISYEPEPPRSPDTSTGTTSTSANCGHS